MNTILFLGSNPSISSLTDEAFHISTRSSQLITEWVRGIQGNLIYVNVSTQKTKNNRPLSTSEIHSNLETLSQRVTDLAPNKIVALGKTAAKALTLLHLEFYEMPHPSGCNRKLNDKKYVAEKIKGLLEYSNNPSTESIKT